MIHSSLIAITSLLFLILSACGSVKYTGKSSNKKQTATVNNRDLAANEPNVEEADAQEETTNVTKDNLNTSQNISDNDGLCSNGYFGNKPNDLKKYLEDDSICAAEKPRPGPDFKCYRLDQPGNTAVPLPPKIEWATFEQACRHYGSLASH